MTALPISRQLLPPRRRIQELSEQLVELRGQLKVAKGVQVMRVWPCGCCGPKPPDELPENCLVVVMGCLKQIPVVMPPPVPAAASRVERPSIDDSLGRGLGPERSRRLLKTITLL